MNTMYFTCSTLRTLLRVSSCERNRADKNPTTLKQACNGCKKWEAETTDPLNLKTQEEVLNPVQAELNQPQPQKFDLAGEISRVCNLHIGHYPYRDTNRKVHPT